MTAAPPPAPGRDGFVAAGGGGLHLGGRPFRFLGTNCYFLQEEGAREALGWEGYRGRVDEALGKAAGLGIRVVRAWAFNDDPGNPAAIQPAPGRLAPAGLAGIDLALLAARTHGVRLLLSLVNYWSDYGGVSSYLRWHGLPPDEPLRFFSDRAVVAHYSEHVEALLGRRNPLTGLRWGEDPAVLGWELANEPRGGEQMAAWVDALLPVVRRAAPRHLVSTGGEGRNDAFETTLPMVDLASVHLYPEEWGWPRRTMVADGVRWIERHAALAGAAGKPLVIGEFGLRTRRGVPLQRRRRAYRRWLEAARAVPAVAGACSWSFSTDDRPDRWDEYAWTWRDGTAPEDRRNRYADLFRDEAARWSAGGPCAAGAARECQA